LKKKKLDSKKIESYHCSCNGDFRGSSCRLQCSCNADFLTSCMAVIFFLAQHYSIRSISTSLARYVRAYSDIPTGSDIVNNAKPIAFFIVFSFLKDAAAILAVTWAWTRAKPLCCFVVFWSSLVAFTSMGTTCHLLRALCCQRLRGHLQEPSRLPSQKSLAFKIFASPSKRENSTWSTATPPSPSWPSKAYLF
jgi:hypothetical protein